MTRVLDRQRLELRGAGTMRAIVRTEYRGRRRVRILACGHELPVPDGGGSKYAQRARCRLCLREELQTVPPGTVRYVEPPRRVTKRSYVVR